MKILEVRGLDVTIPMGPNLLHPVRDVSLDVAAGETVCIVGESGSGKSVTALAMTALLPRAARRAAESIRICGEETRDFRQQAMLRVRGASVGFIFQDPMTSLNPVFPVGDQIIEGFVAHRRGDRTAGRKRALMLLDRVGVASPDLRLKQYPHELSGGLRQRIMIAMALMCSPALLIADEPTTALDVTTQVQILALLKDLQRELGMAVVLISHDIGVVSAVGDRIYVMYAGQIVESGPADSLLTRPAHPYLEGLLACVPVPGATPRGTRLSSIRGVVPLVTKDLRGCAFRDRCDYSHDGCASAAPPLAEVHPGHQMRCLVSPATRGRRSGSASTSGARMGAR